MVTLIFGRLYLATLNDARKLHAANPQGIKTVVNCTCESILNGNICELMLDMKDGQEVSKERLKTAIASIRAGLCIGPVLICCHAARSRSVGIVVAYLYSCGMSWPEAEAYVYQQQPGALIHPIISLSLRRAFGIAPSREDDFLGGSLPCSSP